MKIHAEFHSVAEMASFARLVQSGLAVNPNAKFKDKDKPAVDKDWQAMYERTEANLQRALHRLSLADPQGKTANYDFEPDSKPKGAPQMSIADMEFTNRTFNCLNMAGIYRLEELLAYKEKELMKLPNLGRKSMKDIHETLALHNLKLSEAS